MSSEETKTDEQKLQLPQPFPAQGIYKANFYKALARSPRRLWNYIKAKRADFSAKVNYPPIRLDIENVSRCNLSCTMCQVSEWPRKKRAEDMSLESFKKLIDQQYGVLEIKLQGLGEPLLGGDNYFEMIRYARSKGIWMRCNTNGTLLHIRDNYRKLIASDICEIQVSVDGTTKETFEMIRQGSRFEQVVENCKMLNAYCKKNSHLRPLMWSVIQQVNVHEFRNFVPFAKELGFTRLNFTLELTDWGIENWQEKKGTAAEARSLVSEEMIQDAIEAAQKLDVFVGFWYVKHKFSSRSKDQLCPWPFERAYISSDLLATPCCVISNPEVFNFGNAEDFSKIWLGKKYEDFRRAHIEGRIPGICRSCYDSQV